MRDKSEDLTLRDFFATYALMGLITRNGYGSRGIKGTTLDSYKFADEMLKTRENTEELIEKDHQNLLRKHIEMTKLFEQMARKL